MRLMLFSLFINLLITGLSFSQPVLMYPGDANNDGKADHFDVLPIGVAYGQNGPPRDPASPDWAPQLAELWPLILPVSQIDLAFVDSNGDGTIDSLDIEAIALNYDSTQNGSIPPPFPYIERLTQFCFSCPQPQIVVTFDQDTVAGLDTFSATFVLRYPPNVPPPLGALGIAFDVEYDYEPDKIIDSLTKVYPDTIPDNRMYIVATHTNVSASGLLPPAGKIGFGAAGRGQNVYFATTPLFTAEFVIEDMIIRKGGAAELFALKISNVLILNAHEQIIGLGGIVTDTVVVAAKEAFRRPPLVQLSPNPVGEILTIESLETPIEKIEIHDLDGGRIIEMKVGGQNRVGLPIASLPLGIWLAIIQTREGVVVKKFVKAE